MRGLIILLLAGACTSCNGPRNVPEAAPVEPTGAVSALPAPSVILDEGPVHALPKAVVYKTNGNYDDRVTANYDASTGRFISFPGPSDITASSTPLRLGDGWLLDRQGGIGTYTVFLRWTYREYMNLPKVPDLTQLKEAIITGAKVTEYKVLDMTPMEAASDTAKVNLLLRSDGGKIETTIFVPANSDRQR